MFVVLLGSLLIFLRYWHGAYKTRIVWIMSIAITTLLALGILALWIAVATMPGALDVGRPLLASRGAREATFPELYYTVTIKRDLFVPFMTYLIPALITAIMLFFGLMITTKELDRRSQISWNVANVLSYCAALLFVALLAHIKMRRAVGAEGAASYATTPRCDGV